MGKGSPRDAPTHVVVDVDVDVDVVVDEGLDPAFVQDQDQLQLQVQVHVHDYLPPRSTATDPGTPGSSVTDSTSEIRWKIPSRPS